MVRSNADAPVSAPAVARRNPAPTWRRPSRSDQTPTFDPPPLPTLPKTAHLACRRPSAPRKKLTDRRRSPVGTPRESGCLQRVPVGTPRESACPHRVPVGTPSETRGLIPRGAIPRPRSEKSPAATAEPRSRIDPAPAAGRGPVGDLPRLTAAAAEPRWDRDRVPTAPDGAPRDSSGARQRRNRDRRKPTGCRRSWKSARSISPEPWQPPRAAERGRGDRREGREDG